MTNKKYPRKPYQRTDSPRTHWQSDEYLGFRPSAIDWARLAAYVDGEGSIGLSPRTTNTGKSLTLCAKVVVTNTDFRLAKWCMDTFGMRYHVQGTNWAGKRSANWKTCFHAQASGYKAAWILRNISQWLIMKREQADVVLEHQALVGPDVWKRGPGVTTPQNILDLRMECKRRLAELNKRGPQVEVVVTDEVMEA